MLEQSERGAEAGWRQWLWVVIFKADTPAGRTFDILLIVAIVASVLTVMVESVPHVRAEHGPLLHAVEWGFTGLFTVEYLLRLYAVRHPLRYAVSFFGVVDLLAILPTYLSLLLPGAQYLLVVRAFRLLRVFRVLKLTRFLTEAHGLRQALRASAHKISVFLLTVVAVVIIVGSVMYLVEGGGNGFTSIPRSMYWTVVTLTTVGYGDIAPRTVLGQTLASFVMVLGYGIIAVPTGIVTVELANAARVANLSPESCPGCGVQGHVLDARFCKHCGTAL